MRTAPQCSLMMTLSSKLRISTRTGIKARFFFAPSTTTRTCWNRDESTLSTLKMFSFTYLAGNEIMLLERASASMSRMSLRKCVLHKQLNDNCSIHTLHTHTHTRTNLIQGSGVCAVAEITKPFAVIVWIAMQGWSIYFPFFGGGLIPSLWKWIHRHGLSHSWTLSGLSNTQPKDTELAASESTATGDHTHSYK